jgi:cytochrome c553
MRKFAGVLTLALVSIGVAAVVLGQDQGQNLVSWAYGFTTAGPDPVPPPCPADSKAHDCARPGRAWPEDGIPLSLPGTDRNFTIAQVQSYYDPADWYPSDHPSAPAIVQYGREKDHVRACAHCHYHNGQGKPENAHLTGLPVNYFVQQMALFKSGGRKSADPRKANTNEMIQITKWLTEEETKAAAEYYASIKWKPWVRVVESETAPKTRQSPAGLFIPLEGAQKEPLGQRIIEVPEDPDRTERLRDPRLGFVAYVPIGSIEKGKALVTTGGAGKTIQCTICHGPDLNGFGDVPALADRTASYTMRQLYNYKQGTRDSLMMKAVVANLNADDMIAIVAYLASL